VPLDECRGVLVQIVGAGRDEAVDAARHGAGAARIGDEEDGLLALLKREFGGDHLRQEALVLLEALHELLPVHGLEC
jgi:hypothetical protein